ncbi:MAG: ABC transporter substrate-binding protein [Candidatus Binatia bacterium]
MSKATISLMICFLLCHFPAHGSEKVRVGLSALSPTNWAIWMAEDLGLFKKYGIEPEVVYIGGGAARGINALASNEVQFMAIGGVGAINAALRGLDVVMVASNVNLGTQRIISHPGLKNPKDLKGRRVGVSAFGSNTHSTLLMVLKRWSIRPEEMTVLQVGPSPTMLISLQKGWIDAAVVTSPTDFIAEEYGYGILADLAAMRLYTLQSTIAARREYLRTQEDQAVRFIKGYAEAVAYIAKNKNVAVDVLKKRLRMDATHDKHIEKTYQRYTSKYFDRVPYVSTPGVKTLLEFLENDNPKAKGADPSAFIDARIVRTLDQSGFFNKLYE